jgi:hypothetical protein
MEPFFEFLICIISIMVALFLPALIELKKPKDVGPRKIVGFQNVGLLQVQKSLESGKSSKNVNLRAVALDSLTNIEV